MPRLTSPQVNLLLATTFTLTTVTGIVSWGVGTGSVRIWTVLHTIFAFMTLLLAPAKTRTSVRTGMRRKKSTRWISITFGVLVLASILFGFLHSSGLWFGVSVGSASWIHLAAGFTAIPLLIWHIRARPVNVRRISFDRRMVMRGAMTAGLASIMVGVTEVAFEAFGTAGADRSDTGSHEIASGNPTQMPVVSWYNDVSPTTSRDDWELTIGGQLQDLDVLTNLARPLDAVLDCTGGWWSEQSWDVVPVSELLDATARSFKVTSETGYSMVYAMEDAANLFVSVGYGGEALRRGHGAPVRLVAPGRRGPWWIKWVVSIEPTDQPSWLQFPFPLA